MAYSPGNLPDFSGATLNDLASFLYQELENISQEVSEKSILELRPRRTVPNKFGAGTVCLFTAGTSLNGYTVPEASVWIYLNGGWKQLALVGV